jgi:hypothetical protein
MIATKRAKLGQEANSICAGLGSSLGISDNLKGRSSSKISMAGYTLVILPKSFQEMALSV